VDVQTGTRFIEQRLGHESSRSAVAEGFIFHDVLSHHRLVGHLQQGGKLYLNLMLTATTGFMVMILESDANLR